MVCTNRRAQAMTDGDSITVWAQCSWHGHTPHSAVLMLGKSPDEPSAEAGCACRNPIAASKYFGGGGGRLSGVGSYPLQHNIYSTGIRRIISNYLISTEFGDHLTKLHILWAKVFICTHRFCSCQHFVCIPCHTSVGFACSD